MFVARDSHCSHFGRCASKKTFRPPLLTETRTVRHLETPSRHIAAAAPQKTIAATQSRWQSATLAALNHIAAAAPQWLRIWEILIILLWLRISQKCENREFQQKAFKKTLNIWKKNKKAKQGMMTKISPQKMPKQGISKKNNGKNKKWILSKKCENSGFRKKALKTL